MAGTAKSCIGCLCTWSYLGWTMIGLIILSVFSAVSVAENDLDYYDKMDDLDFYQNYNIDQLLALRDPRFYEFNFNEDFLRNRLMNVAIDTNTSPEQFQDELRLLVGSVGAGFSSSPSPQIARLQRKFNISESFPAVVNPSEGMQFPDTITLGRLALMFPQYFRFDLVKLVRKNGGKLTDSDFNKQCQTLYEMLPGIIKHPEFAGLIPTSSGRLEKTAWKKLITAYFTWQICDIDEAGVAVDEIRKTVAIGLRRMQISRLPDALRVRFLKETRELSDFNKISKIDSAFDSYLPSFDESGEKIEFGNYKITRLQDVLIY